MDSKSGQSSSSFLDDPAPPPTYAESQHTGASTTNNEKSDPLYTPFSGIAQHPFSRQIQQQLSSITSTVASVQTQKSLLTHAHDEKILALLTTQIQIYLSNFATSGLSKGTLILVPQAGLKDQTAIPPDFLESKDRFDRVARISDNDLDLEIYNRAREDFGYGYEEEVESGDLWFWRDQGMAERLAGYLRPPPRPPSKRAELRPRREEPRAVPPQVRSSSSSSFGRNFWGKRKEVPAVEEPLPPMDAKLQEPPLKEDDRTDVDVTAEEVYFRTENDFGILGSKTGYCIVLKLRVVLAQR